MNRRTPIILLDDAREGQEKVLRFAHPLAIVAAREPEEVSAALAALEGALGAGHFVAGYFSYELGYLLEPRLRALLPAQRQVPLLWFGIFKDCDVFEGAAANALFASPDRAYAGPLQHEWDGETYGERFAQAHDWIGAGDIYQANLSFRSRFRFMGDPLALYSALRDQSRAAHGAYIDDGERHVLSLSPELFFNLSASGELTAKPMKGTAARAKEAAADEEARDGLVANPKERAENLMIVDLLRNDLGRIAQTGSVAVENLFAVETYPTLHTLVSTVTARVRPHIGVTDILTAIFPCGSVTGTPKIRAMEVIHALEQSPRGVYCGAIGYFAPDGSANFNVAIRTLTITDGEGELGIGGAVTHDSNADAEYAECLLKARYYENARLPLKLIETLRWQPGTGFIRLSRHLSRMNASAAAFGIAFDEVGAAKALEAAVAGVSEAMRVRLLLIEAGRFSCTAAVLGESSVPWRYAISADRVSSNDQLLRHKTSWRGFYEEALARLSRNTGCDEVLFINERGELTEGSRTNLFIERDGRLLTPPLSAGLLNGCLREELLDEGKCEEAVLAPSDLNAADTIYLGNSLRGLIRAVAW